MTVVIVGTLDTKGSEITYARDCLDAEGVAVHLLDTSVMDEPEVSPGTPASAVAAAAGTTLEALRATGDRGEAMEAMGKGAAAIVQDRHREGSLDGVLGLGETYHSRYLERYLPRDGRVS